MLQQLEQLFQAEIYECRLHAGHDHLHQTSDDKYNLRYRRRILHCTRLRDTHRARQFYCHQHCATSAEHYVDRCRLCKPNVDYHHVETHSDLFLALAGRVQQVVCLVHFELGTSRQCDCSGHYPCSGQLATMSDILLPTVHQLLHVVWQGFQRRLYYHGQ